MRNSLLRAASLAALLLLAAPAWALGANTFVDEDQPNNNGNCLTPATACRTMSGAAGGVAKAGAGDTVFIDDEVYTSATETFPISLTNGKSLVAAQVAGGVEEPVTIIDSLATITIEVPNGASAGTISGIAIVSDTLSVRLLGPATLTGNTFFDPDFSADDTEVRVDVDAGASVISGNAFTDADTNPATAVADLAIRIISSAPTVSGNTITGFNEGIEISGAGADPQLTSNTISMSHGGPAAGFGTAITIQSDAEPTLTANTIENPVGNPDGVVVNENPGTADHTDATLRRNRILGAYREGFSVSNATGVPSLDGDLIAGALGEAIVLSDLLPEDPIEGNATATNVTLFDNGTDGDADDPDIAIASSNIALDSSILGSSIDQNGNGVCTISFSRGLSDGIGTPDCDTFQTAVNPGFVGGGNYHLVGGSPMIDAGNPASPGPFSLDLDGQARAIDADGACPLDPARDMGSDEFAAVEPFCPAIVPPPAVPSTPQRSRKCKKKRKRGQDKSATVAAKKKKKCKRKKKRKQ